MGVFVCQVQQNFGKTDHFKISIYGEIFEVGS